MRFAITLLLVLFPLAFAAKWQKFCGDMSCPNVAIDITCADRETCYIAGGYSNTAMGVYMSTNNVDWDLADQKDGPLMTMALDAHTAGAVAVGGMGMLNNSAIMASQDGVVFRGAKLPYPFVGQDIKAIRNGATSPFEAAFGYVGSSMINNKDVCLFSRDGGATFNIVHLPENTETGGARYGSYPSAMTWYVTGGSWPSSDAQVAQDTLNNCYRVSKNVCQPAGDANPLTVRKFNSKRANGGYIGTISKTEDGGKTWTIVNKVDDYYYNDISCTDENTCVAVGEGEDASGIYRTEDGGNTWVQVFEQKSSFTSLFKIRFAGDGKTAFAAGGNADKTGLNGVLIKSTDGGKTWEYDAKVPGVGIMVGLHISEDGLYGAALGITNEQTSVIMRYL